MEFGVFHGGSLQMISGPARMASASISPRFQNFGEGR
jgi:hypothetical protein